MAEEEKSEGWQSISATEVGSICQRGQVDLKLTKSPMWNNLEPYLSASQTCTLSLFKWYVTSWSRKNYVVLRKVIEALKQVKTQILLFNVIF